MKKITFYIFLTGLISVTGCKKFLEKEPDNRTTPTSPEQITQLLVTAYPKASYLNFAESMSDNVEDKGREPTCISKFFKQIVNKWKRISISFSYSIKFPVINTDACISSFL